MMISRRQFSSLVAATSFGATALPASASDAASYPNRPIEIVVGYGAGGVSDVVIRAIAKPLARILNQQIIITNKPGAGGTLGPATMAAREKPDGYVLSFIPMALGRQPLMQKTSWDPMKDFTYISMLTDFTIGIAVPTSSPFTTLAELLAYAKANPRKVTYAALGPGSGMHLGMERVAQQAGVEFTYVPYGRPGDILQAILGGHVMVQVDASSWAPHIEAGKLRLLALGTEARSKKWPSVPTLKELGYPFTIDGPFGVAGPAGMDPAIVRKLDAAFAKCLEDREVLDVLDFYDMSVNYLNAANYRAYMDSKMKSEGVLLKSLGLAKSE